MRSNQLSYLAIVCFAGAKIEQFSKKQTQWEYFSHIFLRKKIEQTRSLQIFKSLKTIKKCINKKDISLFVETSRHIWKNHLNLLSKTKALFREKISLIPAQVLLRPNAHDILHCNVYLTHAVPVEVHR